MLRDHRLGYSLGRTLLSLHSEQWDLLPSSLCSAGPAMSPHRQPGLQQRNFHARLPSLRLMSPAVARCFSGTTCRPEEHLSRGCLLPRSPANSRTRQNSRPGRFSRLEDACRDGVLSQQTQSVLLGRSRAPCSFSSVGIAVGQHPAVGPCRALLQRLQPWAVPDPSPTSAAGRIQPGSGLREKWFPPFMRQSLLGGPLRAQSHRLFFGPKDPF